MIALLEHSTLGTITLYKGGLYKVNGLWVGASPNKGPLELFGLFLN
jgi:hypothetical protein